MAEIKVNISGPVGSGKTALAFEIEKALLAIGVPVRFDDEQEMAAERGVVEPLPNYGASVVIEEAVVDIEADRRAQEAIDDDPASALGLAVEEVAGLCGFQVDLWEASDTQIRVTLGAIPPSAPTGTIPGPNGLIRLS
ncbi:hypothetical protein [Methylosinus sp. PW1]|uniref:hypothetical protein n=1 Tax=Methylosinus sp. PW1 TaxID=107636 RepID=UPI0012EB05C0|nr:hypothetical protein [Methylosinus sp. PW1]